MNPLEQWHDQLMSAPEKCHNGYPMPWRLFLIPPSVDRELIRLRKDHPEAVDAIRDAAKTLDELLRHPGDDSDSQDLRVTTENAVLQRRIRDLLEASRKPEWVTRKQLHDIAKGLSPSAAPKLKTFQHLQGFKKADGKKDHVADYQKLLPDLRRDWPEIPWPSHVSNWD